ncbi:MAG: VanZ family protein [Candidatus Omnitrophota bacterium]
MKSKKLKVIDVLIAGAYLAFIYLTLPVMPRVWESLSQALGPLADYVAQIILMLAVLAVGAYSIAKHQGALSILAVAIIMLCYLLGLNSLKLSIERIHFVEYGILAVLIWRALRGNFSNNAVYLWSAMLVTLAGFIDECIQYRLPTRVYDNRDVLVNAFSGILALGLVAVFTSAEKNSDADQT